MRLKDIITPHELTHIFEKELRHVISLGARSDLKAKYVQEVSSRLDVSYLTILHEAITDSVSAGQAFRVLCLIDQFLEEKYGSANSTTH